MCICSRETDYAMVESKRGVRVSEWGSDGYRGTDIKWICLLEVDPRVLTYMDKFLYKSDFGRLCLAYAYYDVAMAIIYYNMPKYGAI